MWNNETHTAIQLLGTTKPLAVTNCKELLAANPSVTSGVYWIDPDGGPHDNAFTAYCDQDTDGGGWTLVWSYGFTDYVNFNKPQNAITPRPNWQCNTCDVDVSTTPPSSETDYNAMEFRLWREIGSDVLIKSNINNWVACKPGTGSLLDWQEGSVTCRLIKEINPKCEVIPSRIKFFNHGPAFAVSRLYYYFDGYKGNNWPTHDPCGMNLANQLTGVANPHGNIFVRWVVTPSDFYISCKLALRWCYTGRFATPMSNDTMLREKSF